MYSVEPTFTVQCGDSLEILKTMPDESIHCCVTSPPYYGLRDYRIDGQVGLEETPEAYITRLVDVFREVRRVLRDDGTLWVNIGDSYVGALSQHRDSGSFGKTSCIAPKTKTGIPQAGRVERNRRLMAAGLKMKDLIGIPWMLALALRADGWYLRSEIVWHKPNPMPESVKDRPTKSHEPLYLLAKSATYYYNYESILETATSADGSYKNKRSVWHIPTKPYREAHFATFPLELPETCIKAGSPEGGLVLDPFSGAGTTGIAAVKNGRSYIGIELNPEYAEMSNRRFVTERDRTIAMPRSTSSANIEALFQ